LQINRPSHEPRVGQVAKWSCLLQARTAHVKSAWAAGWAAMGKIQSGAVGYFFRAQTGRYAGTAHSRNVHCKWCDRSVSGE